MPFTRLVVLIWAIVTMSLLGAWAHSLFRKTIVVYDIRSKQREGSIGIVAGSVELRWASIRGGLQVRNHLRFHMLELKKESVPGPLPEYKLGRFHHERIEVGAPPNRLFRVTIEFPIWVLLLLATALSLLTYRRALKKSRPPGP